MELEESTYLTSGSTTKPQLSRQYEFWIFIFSQAAAAAKLLQLCLTLCDPMGCSTPSFPVYHQLLGFTQTHVHRVCDAIQPSHPLSPLLLLPSIFPSNRVFSNESALCIRWTMYWSFSFSISPSNEYSALISFRVYWFDLLAIQGLSRVFSNTTVQKHQFFSAQLSSQSNSHVHT